MLENSAFWGCPDWRELSEYGDWKNWSELQWRWEFKRRSQLIRVAFQMKLQKYWRERFEGHTPIRAMWMDEFAKLTFPLDGSDTSNFGFSPLPNPLYSEAINWLNDDLKYSNSDVLKETLESRTLRPEHILNREKRLFGRNNVLDPTQIAIVFDPNRPIEPQLAGIEEHLQSYRHHSIKRLKRKHKDKWIRYLRVLDAREDGASWSECADVLLQGSTAATPQTASDTYAQAVLTRDGL